MDLNHRHRESKSRVLPTELTGMIILVRAAGNAPALNSLINTAPLFSARRAYLSLCITQINSTHKNKNGLKFFIKTHVNYRWASSSGFLLHLWLRYLSPIGEYIPSHIHRRVRQFLPWVIDVPLLKSPIADIHGCIDVSMLCVATRFAMIFSLLQIKRQFLVSTCWACFWTG